MAHRLQNIAIFEKLGAKVCNDYTDAGLVYTWYYRMNCKRGCKNWKIKKKFVSIDSIIKII